MKFAVIFCLITLMICAANGKHERMMEVSFRFVLALLFEKLNNFSPF